MKHQKVFLVEKEFDKELNSTERLKKIAFGYLTLELANKAVEQLNKECLQCPRRAALHTVYRVIGSPINIRMLSADETYKEKMADK